MPRRFFRKFAFKRHELVDRWYFAPFRRLLHDHRLWGIRRKTVVPAFALGLFVSSFPFPGHVALATLAALFFRVNIPVAAVATFIVNPITMYPVFYFAYRVGAWLLSIQPGPFSFELSMEWVSNTLGSIWQPMLLGCVVVGSVAALVGFVALDALWRYSVHDYKSRKRKERGL
jgi:uncharacterized protein (DUF2062 family)